MEKKFYIIMILVISILALVQIPETYSLFNSSASGDGDVTVANFRPKLNGSVNLNQTINLRYTISDSNYSNPYLTPGTSGTIDLDLDFSNADISADYSLGFANYNLPDNLKFYTDSSHTSLFTSFDGTYDINGTKTFSHKVYWYWEEKTDADSIANDLLFENKDLEVQVVSTINKKIAASYE